MPSEWWWLDRRLSEAIQIMVRTAANRKNPHATSLQRQLDRDRGLARTHHLDDPRPTRTLVVPEGVKTPTMWDITTAISNTVIDEFWILARGMYL